MISLALPHGEPDGTAGRAGRGRGTDISFWTRGQPLVSGSNNSESMDRKERVEWTTALGSGWPLCSKRPREANDSLLLCEAVRGRNLRSAREQTAPARKEMGGERSSAAGGHDSLRLGDNMYRRSMHAAAQVRHGKKKRQHNTIGNKIEGEEKKKGGCALLRCDSEANGRRGANWKGKSQRSVEPETERFRSTSANSGLASLGAARGVHAPREPAQRNSSRSLSASTSRPTEFKAWSTACAAGRGGALHAAGWLARGL